MYQTIPPYDPATVSWLPVERQVEIVLDQTAAAAPSLDNVIAMYCTDAVTATMNTVYARYFPSTAGAVSSAFRLGTGRSTEIDVSQRLISDRAVKAVRFFTGRYARLTFTFGNRARDERGADVNPASLGRSRQEPEVMRSTSRG
jgi:hypothetical protein